MPWFRLDDSFHSHPKVIAAGNEAVGLYVRCGTYAAEHLTDGFVGKPVVLLYGSDALAARLVEAKLWHRTRGGWNIHDYLDYNPSREAVLKERKAAAERQQRKRAREAAETQTRHSQTPVDNRQAGHHEWPNGSSDSNPSRRDSQRDTAVSHTTPARPDPYISGTGFRSATGSATGGPSPASRNPASRPVEEVLRPEPGHRAAPPARQAAAAAAAREALAGRQRPP